MLQLAQVNEVKWVKVCLVAYFLDQDAAKLSYLDFLTDLLCG